MTINGLNIDNILLNAQNALKNDTSMSPSMRSMFEMLIMIIGLLVSRMGLNSKNSSKPPSQDINRVKVPKTETTKKPGGQLGRLGVTLLPVENPDEVITLPLNIHSLPLGDYVENGYEARQVVELDIKARIIEYRALVFKNMEGKTFTAEFPAGVTRAIQYGSSVKACAVYLSQHQLLPYERTAELFKNQADIPISVGTLFNFNKEAYERLEDFEMLVKEKLKHALLLHADETGINIGGKKHWLHCASNAQWTHFHPHTTRGTVAMAEAGILPEFTGTMIHDHWKPYYTYTCLHALCNAHHIRELQWDMDNTESTWAEKMQKLLLTIHDEVKATAQEVLEPEKSLYYRNAYREIVEEGLSTMPQDPDKETNEKGKKKRGRIKHSKEHNLLIRLRDYENDILRFMDVSYVPFTNNRGENDIRMTKVQQKISGCFQSLEGAQIFCRVRSYLLTAQKHGISASEALKILFSGKLPSEFYA